MGIQRQVSFSEKLAILDEDNCVSDDDMMNVIGCEAGRVCILSPGSGCSLIF